MPLDRESSESVFKAGTVRLPPDSTGRIVFTRQDRVFLGAPSVEITEKIAPGYRILRTVGLANIRVMRMRRKSAGQDNWSTPITLLGPEEIQQEFKDVKEDELVRGSMHVEEQAPVLMCVEMGVTAAESVECDAVARPCDPCPHLTC